MGKLNIFGVIALTIIVNAIFVFTSYLIYDKFKLSILHIIFGLLPLILLLRKKNPKAPRY